MRRLLLVPLLLLTGCGEQPDRVASGEVLHTGSGTVLESPAHGPELCFSVDTSLPPQCGGVPLKGWDWSAVESDETANGTTWGEYAVTGRWDGTTLTVIEPPGPPRPPEGVDDPIETPCETPQGGWRAGSRGTVADALEHARAQADHAGAWVDDERGVQVLTLAFTGDLDRHRREIERRYDGPLCLVEHKHSLAELARMQEELSDDPTLPVASSWTLEHRNVVGIGVVAITPDQQRALDERYGAGTVEVLPLLTPNG